MNKELQNNEKFIRCAGFIALRVIPVIAYAQENTPSGIMKSSVTAFPHIKKDAALTGGIFRYIFTFESNPLRDWRYFQAVHRLTF